MIRRLLSAFVALAVLLTIAAAPAKAGTWQVSHDCTPTDTNSAGYRGGICVDGYLIPYNGALIYDIQIEYMCAHDNALIACHGVAAFGREYVSPAGWQSSHRYTCGVYLGPACSSTRDFDTAIPSIVEPVSGCHYWAGEALDYTFNVGGALFTGTWQGPTYTVCG